MKCTKHSKKLCSNIECQICFDKSFASHPKANCWSSKNENTPRDVFCSGREKIWMDCKDCLHSYEISLHNISNDSSGCPYCSNRQLCKDIKCQTCFNKSFASHSMISCWSVINKINPRDTFLSSTKRGIFDCNKCQHSFEAALHNITVGYGCPYCTNQKLCSNIECQVCFNKSFASHPMASCWSMDNPLKPRDVFQASHKKYKFKCDQCHHSFETALHNIKADYGCSFCSNKRLCSNIECQICFDKSFACHPKANCWSSKNEKAARDVFKGSHFKYTLNCDECHHSFEAYLKNVAYGGWCSHCKKKTELKLYKWLLSQYSMIQREQKFDWCKNEDTKNYYRFDFLLPDRYIIIELDGRQHFEDVNKSWKSSYEDIQQRDIYKMKKAIENGYSIVRIFQEDVMRDVNDWKNKLINTISICDIKHPSIHYICKNNAYDVYKSQI